MGSIIITSLMTRTLPVLWLILVGWDLDRIWGRLAEMQNLPSPAKDTPE